MTKFYKDLNCNFKLYSFLSISEYMQNIKPNDKWREYDDTGKSGSATLFFCCFVVQ